MHFAAGLAGTDLLTLKSLLQGEREHRKGLSRRLAEIQSEACSVLYAFESLLRLQKPEGAPGRLVKLHYLFPDMDLFTSKRNVQFVPAWYRGVMEMQTKEEILREMTEKFGRALMFQMEIEKNIWPNLCGGSVSQEHFTLLCNVLEVDTSVRKLVNDGLTYYADSILTLRKEIEEVDVRMAGFEVAIHRIQVNPSRHRNEIANRDDGLKNTSEIERLRRIYATGVDGILCHLRDLKYSNAIDRMTWKQVQEKHVEECALLGISVSYTNPDSIPRMLRRKGLDRV
jgi:hypothetical protein